MKKYTVNVGLQAMSSIFRQNVFAKVVSRYFGFQPMLLRSVKINT